MKNAQYNISISEDNIFAGRGTLTHQERALYPDKTYPIMRVAIINDCPAVFADGDVIYEMIEAAIERMAHPGDGSIQRNGITYSWTLTPAHPTLSEYLDTLSIVALLDIAAGEWDETMTDHLYAAMGCETPEEMQDMRSAAQEAAAFLIARAAMSPDDATDAIRAIVDSELPANRNLETEEEIDGLRAKREARFQQLVTLWPNIESR
jgi:hypothetical protein